MYNLYQVKLITFTRLSFTLARTVQFCWRIMNKIRTEIKLTDSFNIPQADFISFITIKVKYI